MDAEQKELFAGGVPRHVDKLILEEYFSQFGEVENCMIPQDRITGQPLAFGYVSFTDQLVAKRVLEQYHFISHKKIDVRPSKPQHERNQGSYLPRRIFVGGLQDDLTEEDFINYFAKFGAVVDGTIICDKETNTPRGFGFITFESDEAANHALQTSSHELKDKMVDVKRARPQVRNYDHRLWENWYDCNRVWSEFGGGLQIDDLAFGFNRLICNDCGGAFGYGHYEGCKYGTDPYNGAWNVTRFVPISWYVTGSESDATAWDEYLQPTEDQLDPKDWDDYLQPDEDQLAYENPEAANLIPVHG